MKKDFRDPVHFISTTKNPNVRTEFDDLPRIKNSELDANLGDENPQRKRKERVWDKEKKDFVWTKDKEDKESKEEKGKKAYQKWKKKSKLSLPKVGQLEDEEHVKKASESWTERRRFRHGWRENKVPAAPGGRGVNLKNNKTKAIEKKFKKRLITKSQREKSGPAGGKGKGGARGGKAGKGGKAGRGKK